MTEFIKLLKRYSELEGNCSTNREKFYVKEAVLFEGVPKKYRNDYCKEYNLKQVNSGEELIEWMRNEDAKNITRA